MYKSNAGDSLTNSHESPAERREAAERQKMERAIERQRLMTMLMSPKHEPKHRIRLWEQLFGLHLPRDAEHALVRVVAKQTGLSIERIQEEQVRRSAEASHPDGAATKT